MKTFKNYYAILDVSPDASPELLKKAFRKMALKLHPDRNTKNPHAEHLFKEINEAYKILSDAASRQIFDRELLKRTAPRPTAKATPKSSTVHKKSPSPAPATKIGQHLTYHLNVTFDEAILGSHKKISYMREAHGVRQMANISIDIPEGVREGRKLRVRGAGESLGPQQTPGDLVVVIHLLPHDLFTLVGDDLVVTVPISPLDLFFNEPITIPTPSGPAKIAAASWDEVQNPTVRLKERGFPREDNPKRRGDLFVRFTIEVPQRIDENLKEQLKKVKKGLPKTQAQEDFEKLLR